MKKVYEPLNMIMNGRYAVLYLKLAPELQLQVLATIGGLIEEDKEYADKGNYGNQCFPKYLDHQRARNRRFNPVGRRESRIHV